MPFSPRSRFLYTAAPSLIVHQGYLCTHTTHVTNRKYSWKSQEDKIKLRPLQVYVGFLSLVDIYLQVLNSSWPCNEVLIQVSWTRTWSRSGAWGQMNQDINTCEPTGGNSTTLLCWMDRLQSRIGGPGGIQSRDTRPAGKQAAPPLKNWQNCGPKLN